jgi:hypothetical protein
MFLFNLSMAEFLTLMGVSSSLVVALYLLDRSRRTIVVSTLRFWMHSPRPVEAPRRRRIRQWPSLLLQLASIALLLLAISQLRWGSPDTTSLDHVLILDTSAWTAARTPDGTLMDQARAESLRWLEAMPPGDRVMVLWADGLATPETPFESDRRKVEEAIRRARPGVSALNLRQAVDFAVQAQKRHARRAGEIAIAGGRRIGGERAAPETYPRSLRWLNPRGEPRNAGIRRLGLLSGAQRSGSSAAWTALVTLANDGRSPRAAEIILTFGGAPAGSRKLTLPPAVETQVQFDFQTKAAGIVEARLYSQGDDFPADDRAIVELPEQSRLAITVCSDAPQLLRPVFDTLPQVSPVYRTAADCQAKPPSGLTLFDRMAPQSPPDTAIFIEPPVARSPVPASPVANAVLASWQPDHPIAAGLRSTGKRLGAALSFNAQPGDQTVASGAQGALVLTRESGGRKFAVFGFHPMRTELRQEVSAPLLMANTLAWFSPQAFRRHEAATSPAGAVTAPVAAGVSEIRVVDESGSTLPHSLSGSSVRFFAATSGMVRVIEKSGAAERERVYSVSLPEVGDRAWDAPATIRRGVPEAREGLGAARDLWPWLALLGGAGLLFDWLLYAPGGGRFRVPAAPRSFRRAA